MKTPLFQNKIISLEELGPLLKAPNYRENSILVCVTGAFDMLHPGHIRYLWKTSALGDYLIVGIDSDERVKYVKGLNRPLFHDVERAEVVAGLGFVDLVCVFNEMRIFLNAVMPAILVVSPTSVEDSGFDRVNYCQINGGAVATIRQQSDMHTTDYLEKLRKMIQ